MAAKPRAALTKPEARQAVGQFYSSIDSQLFKAAWHQLTPETRRSLGTLPVWSQGHDGRTDTILEDTWVERTSRFSSLVHIDLTTRDRNECGVVSRQRFTGTWRVHESGSRRQLSEPDISFVRGADPELARAACEAELEAARQVRKLRRQAARERRAERLAARAEAEAHQYTDPYEDDGDYGYDGGSGYGSGYDNGDDYYGGSSYGQDLGPGRGYKVTCADGSISRSGGIQGACSWHGGVAGG